MKFKSITAIIVLSLVAASLLVAGCTSNTATPTTYTASTPTPTAARALVMTAKQIPVNDTIKSYYGNNVVQINATITNNNAGTFKTSTDDFYLQDSSDHTSNPVNPVRTSVSDTGYYLTIPLYFTVNSGATPSSLRYYDGTHDISCSVPS